MKLTRRFPILLTLPLFVVVPLSAYLGSKTNAINSGDCETKREYCIKSCIKQRETCDKNNPTDSDYCIKQQNGCDKGCNDAWKKCNEKP